MRSIKLGALSIMFIGVLVFISNLSNAQTALKANANTNDKRPAFSDLTLLAKLKSEQAESGLSILIDLSNNSIVSKSAFSKNGKEYITDTSLFNKPIEPGSVMIPIAAAMIMDNFGVSLNDEVDLEGGKTKLDGHVIMDAEQHGHRKASLKTIIAESSNVGIAKLVYSNFKAHNNQLNFMDQVGEYVGNTDYVLHETNDVPLLPFKSIGYGLLLTPNQILNFYTRVAQSDPTLFKNKSTFIQVQKALEEVCDNGTAKHLMYGSKFSFAGKTGTSLVAGKNGYANAQYQPTFVGYSRGENPKYACLVIIKTKPHAPNHFGAAVAGPVFRSLMEDALNNNQNKDTLNKGTIKVEVPSPYHDALLQNLKYFHHLEDSVSAIAHNELQTDSTIFSPRKKFYVDGKWVSGYDGGIAGYYMSACWKNALPIIKQFVDIDRVAGCSIMQGGSDDEVFHYNCEKYIKTAAVYKNGNPVYRTEYIDVYFQK